MKQKFSFWLIIGVTIGIVLGITLCNMGAALCLSIGSSAIATLLINEYKNEH
jgi:hypothetical protein